MDLFLLVPLTLLAALTVADLVNRRVPVRTLISLAPATAMSVAWWASEDLRGAVDDLLHGRADAATALGLHLALDLILASIWFTRRLERWARRRDDHQRHVLAFFLLTVLAITVGTGDSGSRLPPQRDPRSPDASHHDPAAQSRTPLRPPGRGRSRSWHPPAFLGGSSRRSLPGGLFRGLAAVHPPHGPSPSSQRDLSTVDELLALPEGQRLIIFTGSGQRLSSAVKSKLGLEVIHPGRLGNSRCLCHGPQPAPAPLRPAHRRLTSRRRRSTIRGDLRGTSADNPGSLR